MGRTALVRGSSLTTAAYTRSMRWTQPGYETIMVNCNPETVSTDYDTSDRLYFEPLTAEDVTEIVRKEEETGEVVGLILQYGGQTPLKLAADLEAAGVPFSAPPPTPSTLRKTGRGSRRFCGNWIFGSRPTESPVPATKR